MHVRQRVRVAHRHQDVADARVDVIERQLGRRKEIERRRAVGDHAGLDITRAEREQDRQPAEQRDSSNGGAVAHRDHGKSAHANDQTGADDAQRDLAAADLQVHTQP